MSEVILTPDQIFARFTTGYTCDANNIATIYTTEYGIAHTIEAFIRGSYDNYFVGDDGNPDYFQAKFVFNVESIKNLAPELYDILIGLKP
jgi:hypothetical protein